MKSLIGETPLRLLTFAALLVALVITFLALRILLVPFVAALFVVYLFDPAVVALQRRGFERGPAFLLLLALTLMTLAGMLAYMPAWLRLEALARHLPRWHTERARRSCRVCVRQSGQGLRTRRLGTPTPTALKQGV